MVVSTVIGAVVAGIVKLWTTRHEINRAEEENALKEYQKLVKVQETRIVRLEKKADEASVEFDRLRREHHECVTLSARMQARMEHYEIMLGQAGIKVKPFAITTDTGELEAGQGGET